MFATAFRNVSAYDINAKSARVAVERARILGLDNVQVTTARPAQLHQRILDEHGPGSVDAVLLYALLEHQTLEERLQTLELAWSRLRPDGVLIVGDTPNRLCYNHMHTSQMAFFDMLPESLALRFLDDSPNPRFRRAMKEVLEQSPARATAVLDRMGRGVSFHEFAAVIGDLRGRVVGDGFDVEILSRKHVVLDEQLLLTYLHHMQLPIPAGFARRSLDLLIRNCDPDPGAKLFPRQRASATPRHPRGVPSALRASTSTEELPARSGTGEGGGRLSGRFCRGRRRWIAHAVSAEVLATARPAGGSGPPRDARTPPD